MLLPTVLVVDDDRDFTDMLVRLLGSECQVQVAASGGSCLQLVNHCSFDLILLDLRLPDMGGLVVLRHLQESRHHTPVIVMTAYGGVDSAVRAIRLGAADYVEKPFDWGRLRETLGGWLARRDGEREAPIRRRIAGGSPEIRAVWRSVETFAPTDLAILLQGETGTGKGLFAQAIHELSRRSSRPFVTVDCAGIPDSLLDGELFGYEKGAFTGAVRNKPGRVVWADGGTLFLDDVSEIPLASQAKLLRLLEDRTFTPLGARQPARKPLDVRFVSATNRDLRRAIEENELRQDLFYRLAGVTIELAPLRARQGEVERLVHYFVAVYREALEKPALDVGPEVMEILKAHPWPGNVRELQHVVAAAAAAAARMILPGHLPAYLLQADPCLPIPDGSGPRVRVRAELDCDLRGPVDLKKLASQVAAQAEAQVIAAARKLHPGTREQLAAFLGIDAKTLRRKLRERTGAERAR